MIGVQSYHPDFDQVWDNFIAIHSRNGGIFHERKFLSYHFDGRFVDQSLLLYKEDELMAVLPAVRTDDGNRQYIVSHPGSTYGGIIYHSKASTRDLLEIMESMIKEYAARGFHGIELRLPEHIFSYPSDFELRYLLWRLGFKLLAKEISSSVPLDGNEIWKKLGRKRNLDYIKSLRKKNFIVKQAEHAAIVYPLIEENLASKYNKKPTHTLEELQSLKEKYPDRLHFWTVEEKGVLYAAIVTFEVNEQGVHDFYIAQDYDHAKLQVMALLFYDVMAYYKNKGFKWFNFGISSRGDTIKWGILEFKERMGGRATCRENWLMEDIKNYKPYNFEEDLNMQ